MFSTDAVGPQQQPPQVPGESAQQPRAYTAATGQQRPPSNPLAPLPTWDAATVALWWVLVAFAFGTDGATRTGARHARRVLLPLRRYLRVVLGCATATVMADRELRRTATQLNGSPDRRKAVEVLVHTAMDALSSEVRGSVHTLHGTIAYALGADGWRAAEVATELPGDAVADALRAVRLCTRALRIARELAPRRPRTPRRNPLGDALATAAATMPHVTTEDVRAVSAALGVAVAVVPSTAARDVLDAARAAREAGRPLTLMALRTHAGDAAVDRVARGGDAVVTALRAAVADTRTTYREEDLAAVVAVLRTRGARSLR